MPQTPKELNTRLLRLTSALAQYSTAVIDFETSGVKPRNDVIAGIGVYFPEANEAHYINVGHRLPDDRFPLYSPDELAEALRPFLDRADSHLVAHNATFELRFLLKMGLIPKCRVSCTLVQMHRTDENLTSFSLSPTYHDNVDKVTLGLKELTTIFANEAPPRLIAVTEGRNALFADIKPVADYCIQDCVNTWFLYELSRQKIDQDQALGSLIRDIDEPNHLVMAKMMWAGIGVDVRLAAKHKSLYQPSIQACRDLIWSSLGITSPLESPREALAVLRSMNIEGDVGYDPFLQPFWTDDDPSVTRDILTELFHECSDETNQTVIAAFLSMWLMKQRISSFINPFTEKSNDGRLYPARFSSTLSTTRFSSSPNLQNMPGRADKHAIDDPSQVLPTNCREHNKTRDLFVAAQGHYLVSIDLSAAEPNYLATVCQRALTVREDEYRSRKRELNALRRSRYPVLIEAMYKNRDVRGKEQEIEWPQFNQDPLWLAFTNGTDPYEALLAAADPAGHTAAINAGNARQWIKDNRHVGKKAFLALGYGSTAASLAPKLGWSVERTEQAIANLDKHYPTIPAMKELTLKQLVALGEIRTLWGRPRRINGYYQLARPYPLTVEFVRRRTAGGRGHVRTYRADVIPLGTYRQGVQVFVEQCYIIETREVVLEGRPDGSVGHIVRGDAFVEAIIDVQFNDPPFANIPFSQIRWIQEKANGLIRHLPKQSKAERQAFNAIFQGTGADHLRWLMNRVDAEICSQPEFRDCKLILTVHDSLVYEAPKRVWREFVKAALPFITQRPYWATLDVKVDVEFGIRFGSMKKIDPLKL